MRHVLSLLSVFTLLVGCADKAPEAPKPPLRFGVLPAVDAKNVQEDYRPLTDAMGQALGRTIELVIVKDYASFANDLKSKKIHFGQLSPFLYANTKKDLDTQVLVQQKRKPERTYHGVFVIHPDSGINSLPGLLNKTIAYVSHSSSAGYLYPRIKLRDSGLNPDYIFKESGFAGSHDKVVELVASGQVDVGAVSSTTLRNTDRVKKLEITDTIPDDVIVAAGGLTMPEIHALSTFFKAAHTNPRVASFMGRNSLESYVEHDPGQYVKLLAEVILAKASAAVGGPSQAASAR